jgi:hypothetical protein
MLTDDLKLVRTSVWASQAGAPQELQYHQPEGLKSISVQKAETMDAVKSGAVRVNMSEDAEGR